MIRRAVSTSYSSMTRGGARRSELWPQPSSSRPFLKARSTSSRTTSGAGSRVSRSFTNSTPTIRPRPRKSPIAAIPRGGYDIAALALDRLDENGGDAVRRDFLGEELVFDPRRAAPRALGLAAAVLAPVAIAVGDVVDLGEERAETGALHGLARGETQSSIGPPVESAEEADDRWPSGRVTRELDRAFDRLCPGVRQEDPLLAWPGRELSEPFAQCREALVVEVRAADMKEACGGLLHRFHDLGMAISCRCNRDAGHEIEKAVAVHVLDHGALTARDRQWILFGIRRRGEAILAFDDRTGLGARRRHDDAGIVAAHRHARTASFEMVFSSAIVSRLTISSISGSVIMKGGAISAASPVVPSACPTFGHTVMPVSSAASANRSANFVERGNGTRLALTSTNSMPPSSPRPRTSPTWGRSVKNRSRSCSTRPIWAQRSTSLCCLR